jgi:hypothetical protein
MGEERHRAIAVCRLLAPAVLGALLVACSNSTPSASPTPPSPTPTPSATTPPSPTPTVPAGFQCSGEVNGGSGSSDADPSGPTVTAVRAGGHTGFDRFVLEFDGPIRSYDVAIQDTAAFTLDPKGTPVTLEGTGGVLVTIRHQNWTAYAGPSGLRPELTFLKQARMVQNFEGTMQWGLGIQGSTCLKVSTLQSPPRLVVDVAAT